MKKVLTLLLLISMTIYAQQKGTFTDPRDKKTYKTVKIGEQTWMAENLNYEKKGACVGKTYQLFTGNKNGKATFRNVSKSEMEGNCKKYGRFYWQEELEDICPVGWHLPISQDWEELLDSIKYNVEAVKAFHAVFGGHLTPFLNKDVIGYSWSDVGEVGLWWVGRDSRREAYQITDYDPIMGTNNILAFFSGNDAYYRKTPKEKQRVTGVIERPSKSALAVRCIKLGEEPETLTITGIVSMELKSLEDIHYKSPHDWVADSIALVNTGTFDKLEHGCQLIFEYKHDLKGLFEDTIFASIKDKIKNKRKAIDELWNDCKESVGLPITAN